MEIHSTCKFISEKNTEIVDSSLYVIYNHIQRIVEYLLNVLNLIISDLKMNKCFLGGFPDSSGKESVCNAGDPGSIPGLGR